VHSECREEERRTVVALLWSGRHCACSRTLTIARSTHHLRLHPRSPPIHLHGSLLSHQFPIQHLSCSSLASNQTLRLALTIIVGAGNPRPQSMVFALACSSSLPHLVSCDGRTQPAASSARWIVASPARHRRQPCACAMGRSLI
jgi:hypothetical protein